MQIKQHFLHEFRKISIQFKRWQFNHPHIFFSLLFTCGFFVASEIISLVLLFSFGFFGISGPPSLTSFTWDTIHSIIEQATYGSIMMSGLFTILLYLMVIKKLDRNT